MEKIDNILTDYNKVWQELWNYKTLLGSCEIHLKDYFRKLERDDFDPRAIEKMKDVNKTLEQIKEVV